MLDKSIIENCNGNLKKHYRDLLHKINQEVNYLYELNDKMPIDVKMPITGLVIDTRDPLVKNIWLKIYEQ